MGLIEEDGSWKNADDWFQIVDHVFNILFVLEIVIRIAVTRRKFFREKTAVFDMIIVLVSCFQTYVDQFLGNLLVFRFLRLTRFVRVLRLVRVLKLFSQLRILVNTCISSFGALIWSMVLLLL